MARARTAFGHLALLCLFVPGLPVGASNAGTASAPAPDERSQAATAAAPGTADAPALPPLSQALPKPGDDEAALAAVESALAADPNNRDVLLIRAELLRRRGDFLEAGTIYRRMLDLDPEDAQALIGHAIVTIERGSLELAEADLEVLDGTHPGLPMTGFLRGLVALYRDRPDETLEHWRKALPGFSPPAQQDLLKGVVDASGGDLDRAEGYLAQIVRGIPDNLAARKLLAEIRLSQGSTQGAIDALEPMPETALDGQSMAMLGSAYLRKHRPDEGIGWLRRALAAVPDSAPLRLQLGQALLAQGDAAGVVEVLEPGASAQAQDAKWQTLLIYAYVQDGQAEQARKVADALATRSPRSPVALDLAGYARLAAGDPEGAKASFDAALGLDPDFVSAQVNRARADAATGRLEQAEHRLKQVQASHPRDLSVLLALADLARSRGDDGAVVKWLEAARDADPWTLEPGLRLVRHHLARRDTVEALKALDALETRAPGSREPILLRAQAQTLAGDTAAGISGYLAALAARPNDPKTRFLLANARWKAGDLDLAREDLRRAIELKPDFLEARVGLISLELKTGRLDEALILAESLQKEQPERPEGFALAAEVHARAGRPAEGAAAYLDAYSRGGDKALALATASALYRAGRAEEAIPILRIRLRERPGDREAQLLLALACHGAGHREEAVTEYEKAIELDPENIGALNNLAWLYRELKDARAVTTAERAYGLAPDNPSVADTFGAILLEGERAGEAVGPLRRAYEGSGQTPAAGYRLALALSRAGESEEAISLLRKVVESAPDSPEAAEARGLLDDLPPAGAQRLP